MKFCHATLYASFFVPRCQQIWTDTCTQQLNKCVQLLHTCVVYIDTILRIKRFSLNIFFFSFSWLTFTSTTAFSLITQRWPVLDLLARPSDSLVGHCGINQSRDAIAYVLYVDVLYQLLTLVICSFLSFLVCSTCLLHCLFNGDIFSAF